MSTLIRDTTVGSGTVSYSIPDEYAGGGATITVRIATGETKKERIFSPTYVEIDDATISDGSILFDVPGDITPENEILIDIVKTSDDSGDDDDGDDE